MTVRRGEVNPDRVRIAVHRCGRKAVYKVAVRCIIAVLRGAKSQLLQLVGIVSREFGGVRNAFSLVQRHPFGIEKVQIPSDAPENSGTLEAIRNTALDALKVGVFRAVDFLDPLALFLVLDGKAAEL